MQSRRNIRLQLAESKHQGEIPDVVESSVWEVVQDKNLFEKADKFTKCIMMLE